ncbi:MAG TPA: nickel pincer cofactor biosynthesis protein LarC [Acidimicrobiales bacterium]|nr:nickel pincer cofactor biosynthesis protein LarC [Acidimicrobiales bacterium]
MTPEDVPAETPAPPGPVNIAWFHCFAGIAGDMALGGLLDAGADLDEVVALVRRVRLPGWELRCEPVLRGGIACTRAVVEVAADGTARTHGHIDGLLAEAGLPDRVERRARATFAALARVEGALHRQDPADVHFHEVGGHDAVVDVVGTMAALEVLGVDRVAASAVATGTGTVRSAHGLLPNPSPAVVRLLEGVPTYGRDTPVELTTPTGAAMLATLAGAFGALPPMAITGSGFGAGRSELDDLPNCTQVVLGTAVAGDGGRGQPVTQLEANLDDVTGEQLAHAVGSLLDAGAHDAWVTPAVMKKGRPAHVLHVLCDPALVPALRSVIVHTTGTFGVRAVAAERWPVARRMAEVVVAGEPVGIKVAAGRAKPEFDDVVRVAERTGRPPAEVAALAEEAFRQHRETGGRHGGTGGTGGYGDGTGGGG